MNIVDILLPERVIFLPSVSSKKRALEILSEHLATTAPGLSDAEIFNSLINRERLGSCGLGHGVAIPHGRIKGVTEAIAAALKLEQGVDYDAPDEHRVDLIVALIVPEESTEEHLGLLAQLAEMFSDEATLAQLRATENPAALLALMGKQASSHAA